MPSESRDIERPEPIRRYPLPSLTRSGLVDIFSFIKGYNLAFDLESEWFQDLWYPLTKKKFLKSNHEKDTNRGVGFGVSLNKNESKKL